MSSNFQKSVTFKLDRSHFEECFEQTAKPIKAKDFAKALIFLGLGSAMLFVELEHYYVPFFLIGLSVIELLSIKFRKTWWVWRQLWGRTANSNVTLTFNNEGIQTQSQFVNSTLAWSDVDSIEETEKGIIISHKNGTSYLSNNYLTKEIRQFVLNL